MNVLHKLYKNYINKNCHHCLPVPLCFPSEAGMLESQSTEASLDPSPVPLLPLIN